MVEARNAADQVIYQTEKSLGNLNGQVPEATRQDLEAKIAELKEAMQGEDSPRIQQLVNEVQQASMAIGQAAYGEPGPNGASAAPDTGQSATGNDEDIIEGEFETA